MEICDIFLSIFGKICEKLLEKILNIFIKYPKAFQKMLEKLRSKYCINFKKIMRKHQCIQYVFENFMRFHKNGPKFLEQFLDIFTRFSKIDKKMPKIFIKIIKKLYKVFTSFLQNFLTNSLKLERNIFNIRHNLRKIKNLKLPQWASIIFPELIQILLRNFSYMFLKYSWDFIKIFLTIPPEHCSQKTGLSFPDT